MATVGVKGLNGGKYHKCKTNKSYLHCRSGQYMALLCASDYTTLGWLTLQLSSIYLVHHDKYCVSVKLWQQLNLNTGKTVLQWIHTSVRQAWPYATRSHCLSHMTKHTNSTYLQLDESWAPSPCVLHNYTCYRFYRFFTNTTLKALGVSQLIACKWMCQAGQSDLSKRLRRSWLVVQSEWAEVFNVVRLQFLRKRTQLFCQHHQNHFKTFLPQLTEAAL